MARLHLRPGLVFAALVGALCLPVAASAAWAPPQPVEGPAGLLGLVTSGEAGRVAVGGPQVSGSLFAAAHPPGGVFGASVLAGAGTEDFPAVIGRGGAIAALDGGRPTVRRLRPDGSVSAPVDVGGVDDVVVGRPAVAPSGALLVVVTDESGDAQLWRQPGDGQPATALAFNVADGASVADIAAIGDDQFVVGLSAPNLSGAPGVRVRSIIVTGTAGVAGAPAETTAGAGDSVGELQVVPGTQPALVYTLGTSAGIAVRLAAPTPQSLATADGDTSTLDNPRSVALGAGFAVSWTVASTGLSTTAFAVLPSPGAVGCRGSVGFEQSDIVDRSGPVLVGLRADGAVGIATTDASCAAGTAEFSAAVADAGDLTAGVDGDGTVLALVGRGEAGASAVVPNDTTPPVLGDPSVPARVRSGTPFPASIAASDPWGLSRVVWTVDGTQVAEGTSVTIPGLPAGRHRVEATGTNAAGLTATRGADVVARDDAPAATPTPAPAATPTPPPTPPVTIAEDDVAPVISRVRLRHELFRPRAARVLPRGSAVRFRLSENARTRMTIQRSGIRRGLKRRSRCDGVAKRRKSDRMGLMLDVTRNLKAGANAFELRGRGANGRQLPRGRFRVSLRARDAAGNRSVTRFIRFTLC